MTNYDPDGTPEVDPEAYEEARRLGLHPVHVICDEPGAKVGDHGGVSFIAYMAFIPRAGDRIDLDDGKTCQVRRILFGLSGKPPLRMLIPNVYAVRVGSDEPEE